MLQELIKKRRTVRQFKDQEVDRELLNKLFMYASMAPSNGNSHPVEFLVIDDKEKINELSEMDSYATNYLKECPCVVMFVGNTELSKTAEEECAIVASYFQLLAEEEGLSTAWINVSEGNTSKKISYEEYFKENYNIKKGYKAVCLVPVGYKKRGTKDHEEFDVSSKVHYNEL
ncbi:nitroreductase family protein [uncultured Peptoniphilus sp.]|uniref:nitroreductase family protein n=1 Tax=uncultured Peptoniphilus sp. TaxID=254354 RepID=UPI0028043E5A|nr:nitroreductase family protein [uncultured Peptoniphilus sp.]